MHPNLFPTIPQHAGSNATTDDDVLSPDESMRVLTEPSVVEEKADGINVGIQLDSEQGPRLIRKDRYAHWADFQTLTRLHRWCLTSAPALEATLGNRLAIFGEWIDGTDNVLPFFAFDVLDTTTRTFYSRATVESVCQALNLPVAPLLFAGTIASYDRLRQFLGPSRLRTGPMEGVIIRSSEGPYLTGRFKFVRPGYFK
jgi:hypothetical protein